MVELCLTYFIVYTIIIVLVTIYLTVRHVCPTINSAREPVPVDKKVLQTAPRPSQFDENRWDASPKSLAKPQSPASYDVDSDSDTPDSRQRKPGSQRHNSRRAPDAPRGPGLLGRTTVPLVANLPDRTSGNPKIVASLQGQNNGDHPEGLLRTKAARGISR